MDDLPRGDLLEPQHAGDSTGPGSSRPTSRSRCRKFGRGTLSCRESRWDISSWVALSWVVLSAVAIGCSPFAGPETAPSGCAQADCGALNAGDQSNHVDLASRNDAGAASADLPRAASPSQNNRSNSDANAETLESSLEPGPMSIGHFEQLDDTTPGSLVWVPNTQEPRPLLVVTHGAGGGPDWHCDRWSQIVEDQMFVLCLQGKPMGYAGAFYYPNHNELERMLKAALAKVHERYEGQLLGQDAIYAGYSQGATMGSLMIHRFGELFSGLLLIEGGFKYWSVTMAQRFRRSGGQRVFFACGTLGCNRSATRAAQWLTRAEVQAKVSFARGAGHTPAGRVGELAASGLGWLRDPSLSRPR